MAATAQALALFPLVPGTKKPAVTNWQTTKPGEYQPSGHDGLNLAPHDYLIIDCDPRNYPAGRDCLTELWPLTIEKAPTKVVHTPGGGYHLYYRKPSGIEVKKKQEQWPGVDFLTSGCFAIVPGSGNAYSVYFDAPVAPIPQSFLESLQGKSDAVVQGFFESSLLSEPQFITECQTFRLAIIGQFGDNTTYELACKGRDLGLPKEATFAAMRDHYNPRLEDSWNDSDLWQKVEHAYRYAKNAPGSQTPEAKFSPPEPVAKSSAEATNVISIDTFQHQKVMDCVWQKTLATTQDKAGNTIVLNTFGNLVFLLREDAAWKGRLLYNRFADRLEIKGRPDWRRDETAKSAALTTYDFSHMQAWFSSNEAIRLEVPQGKLQEACFAAASPYHPVQDYLDGLQWDGTPRLDMAFPETLGCIDTPYTRAVGRKLFISAVKRIKEPGCKQDYVVVLEHLQGEKKSQYVAALGGEWYSTGELVVGDKDTYQTLKGKWIVELPEIDSNFNRSDFAWIKKTVTTGSDTYRPSYGRVAETFPRESIFIGTINPNACRQYLRDSENRRWWPIKCGKINLELLKENRDQYFAEAMHYWRQGEANWIEDKQVMEMAKAEQEKRREIDPWVEVIQAWGATRPNGFTLSELLVVGLNMSGGNVNSRHRMRAYAALRDAGYEYDQPNLPTGGKEIGYWKKPKMKWSDLI